MTQDDEVVSELQGAGISPALARQIRDFIHDGTLDEGGNLVEPGALRQQRDGDALLVSTKPRNVIFNWRKLLQAGLMAAPDVATSDHQHYAIDLIRAGLRAIPVL